MGITKDNYLQELFIDEAIPALNRHGSSGEADDAVAELQARVDEQAATISELEAWKNENEFGASAFEARLKTPYHNYLFYFCASLTTVPEFDTSHVSTMASMFCRCSSLTTVPKFNTSKVTSMSSMFDNCSSLTTVPEFDTSKVTNMSSMLCHCRSLTTVPKFDTSKVTMMTSMLEGCVSLTTVPEFDMRNVSSVNSMFNNCNSLMNCNIRNIKTSIQVGSGTTYGHLLTIDSLIHLIYECRNMGSMKTLTVGTANLEKLANVYVKTIEITDTMREEDDLVDAKLPFEVCESTDEGAMLISNYILEKNWQLK